MTFRCRIQQDLMRDGILLSIGRRIDGHFQIVKELGHAGPAYEIVEASMDSPRALRIPDEMAMPLLDALATHYSGTLDMRTLRADYVAERARVDRFIDALIKRDVSN